MCREITGSLSLCLGGRGDRSPQYVTKDIRLTYQGNPNKEMNDCYVDANWAGDAMDRKSTAGYIIRMYGNVIYWKTRKQNSVTKS